MMLSWPEFAANPFLAAAALVTGIPIGTVIAFAGDARSPQWQAVNPNWLECDGSALLKTEYAELYLALGNGTIYGGPDGDHFYLPNYSAQFLRGIVGAGSPPPSGAYADPGPRQAPAGSAGSASGVGSTQAEMVQMHEHDYQLEETPVTSGEGPATGVTSAETPTATTKLVDANGNELSGNETRPVNTYVFFLIKAASASALAGVG